MLHDKVHETCTVPGCVRNVRSIASGLCGAHYQKKKKYGDPLGGRPQPARGGCTVDGCGHPHRAHGYCFGHYLRWKRTGDAGTSQVKRIVSASKPCHADGCTLPSMARGFCATHYQSLRAMGVTPGQAQRACGVDGCERVYWCRGYCQAHYAQLLQKGTVTHAPIKARGNGYVSGDNGYKVVLSPGHPNARANGEIFEHRLVATKVLNRALVDDEQIHHRDGNRTNNTAGPCLVKNACDCEGERHNLELWSSSQPKGQRVEDKLAFVEEILGLYGSKALLERLLQTVTS